MAWSDNFDKTAPAYHIAKSKNRCIRVIAGPGTGKSFAMQKRVARLLENEIPAHTILPVTFTRIAAEDLHRELVDMNVPGCQDLQGRTLHSLALRILMRNHVLDAIGRTPRPLNDFEIEPLEADLATQHGGVRKVRKKLKAYEAAWATLQHDDPGHVKSPADAAFESDLVAWLIFHRAMLIGEVIPQLHSYLGSNPLAQERTEFAHILVDEYQDLNKSEQGVIALLSDNAEVCIVGDDDQSIYSFKHAHPDGIREWLTEHAGADDLSLDDCRRCPTQVVEMANLLIAKNVNRPAPRTLTPWAANDRGDVEIIQYKNLDAEVRGLLDKISALIAQRVPPGDILVLAQRGIIGTPIYEGLKKLGIPARSYYAESELDAEETQRRFAVLKLLVEREDRVALRWLLGLGGDKWLANAYQRLRAHCETTGSTPWDILEQLKAGALHMPHTGTLLARFVEIKSEVNVLEGLNDTNDLEPVINYLFPEGEGEGATRDIRALSLKTLKDSGGEDRVRFLSELTSAIAKPEIPSDIEDVRIMSLHKSKGLSAPVTIIAGCVEGLLPKQPDSTLPRAEQIANVEEQRRLFYVGISRVKSSPPEGKPGKLILTYSQEMLLSDAMAAGIKPAAVKYGKATLLASRFIGEMKPAAPAPIVG